MKMALIKKLYSWKTKLHAGPNLAMLRVETRGSENEEESKQRC